MNKETKNRQNPPNYEGFEWKTTISAENKNLLTAEIKLPISEKSLEVLVELLRTLK